MKYKIYAVITIAICVFCAFVGVKVKSTYTNITQNPNFIMNMKVAELPEELAKDVTNDMKERLTDSDFIIRVRATGEERYIFHAFMQKAEVLQIYQSEDNGPKENQYIYVTKAGWRCYFDEMSVEYGFVNKMQEGKEYLIFLDHKEDSSLDKDVEYDVYDLGEYIIDPIFCYDEIQNKTVPTYGESTYVNYKDVCDNEFFVCTDEGMEYVLELKREMIEKYP